MNPKEDPETLAFARFAGLGIAVIYLFWLSLVSRLADVKECFRAGF